ncbi:MULTISPECIES: hypothetical protein [Aerosakkonema]|uniref:hypothetical protein n=1 Tax=Aerosakkonema TaxID=1246629 RepID=UPI0035B7C596
MPFSAKFSCRRYAYLELIEVRIPTAGYANATSNKFYAIAHFLNSKSLLKLSATDVSLPLGDRMIK